MFKLFGGLPQPALCTNNPGVDTHVEIGCDDSGGQTTERIDLVYLLADILKMSGHSIRRERSWIQHKQSGLIFTPRIVAVESLNGGSYRTISTIQVNHDYIIRKGVFEYQHATGTSPKESIRNGFYEWVKIDLIPLLDAFCIEPEVCQSFKMTFNGKNGAPNLVRRAIFGPIVETLVDIHASSASSHDENVRSDNSLFIPSIEAFREFFSRDEFICLRLYAARGDNGLSVAECRVNGEDYRKGVEALQSSVSKWGGSGYLARKQLVVIRSFDV